MSYDKKFFKKYQNYLLEPKVRDAHNKMFQTFQRICHNDFIEVIDLGCGLCREFQLYGWCHSYLGVDKITENWPDIVKADYLAYKIPKWKNTFTSLFSTECCLTADEKYAFYRRIFKENPNINRGLVSGFYYKKRVEQDKVNEAGGLVSYQTIEDPKKYQCKEFVELRAHLEVPSKLFGSDVVEVWKFFSRC